MNTPLPPILESKLTDFRRRVWVVKLAEGLLAAAFGLALSYVLVFVLDRFFETAGWVRGLLLAGGAAVLGIGVPLKWHRWVWRQRRLEDAARLLRKKHPRLGDQLLGIVELAKMEQGDAGRSERLVRAAMDQAAAAVERQDFANAVPLARHRQWGWAAGAAAGLAVVAFAIVNDAARNALARWIAPWADIERFTFAKVEKVPEKMVVPLAEPFDLDVRLAKDTQWSPENAKSRIKGQPTLEVKRQDGEYHFDLPPQKDAKQMKVSLGDVRKTIEVKPTARPEMVSLSAKLKLPAYLKYQSEPVVEVRSGTISLLRGAEAAFTATASRPLAKGSVDGRGQKIEGERIVTGFQPITESAEKKFAWEDEHGLAPREPLVLHVQAVEDEAPKVAASRETQEQVVLDSEVVAFDLNAQDDFGIKRMGLEWKPAGTAQSSRLNHLEKPGERIAAAGEPEKREIEGRATFCAEREGIASGAYEIRGWAEDYLNGGRRAHSGAFLLSILSKSEHALWLTDQFGKWLQLAKESYEREQQLHATNRELRQMSAEQLDRPENRRRVLQQAAAESANGQRLDSLVENGKRLIEQATKNPEFEAAKLESWAKMSKSLKDIAASRMPSVADMLRQAANAEQKIEGWKPSQEGAKPGSQSPGGEQQGKQGEMAKAGEQSPGERPKGEGKQQAGDPKAMAQADPKQSGQPGQATAKPQDSQTAPSVKNGEQSPGSQQQPGDQEKKDKKPIPSIADNEKGFFPKENKPQDGEAKPKPASEGKLSLPTTELVSAPGDGKKEEEEDAPADSPAKEKMDSALWKQRDLLAEFAKVTDQLQQVLASLEASTFVKRLKLASRRQMEVASGLNQKTLNAFGLAKASVLPEPARHSTEIAGTEKKESETVRVIQSDLEAYFQRKQDAKYKNILDQMKTTQVVTALSRVSDDVGFNLSGQSISTAEFWADTLDRWAEELVAAAKGPT